VSYIAYPTDPPPILPQLSVQGYPVHRKPFFTAWEHKSVSGAQYQSARQIYPNWDFQLQIGDDAWLREQTQNRVLYGPNSPHVELETWSQLFLACFGSYGEFWYRDPEDSSRAGQLIGVGDGSTGRFRIVRTWGFTPLARIEPVGGVDLTATINVYFNGILITPTAYTVTNELTGSWLNCIGAPANGFPVTMDFSFFYRCRWKDDMQQYDQWAYNLWQLGKAEFRSVKP
jgi:hypothetical protein